MPAGRKRHVEAGELYTFAHLFYWDLRAIVEGRVRWRHDRKKYEELAAQADGNVQLSVAQKARARQAAEEEILTGKLPEAEREQRIRYIEEAQLVATRQSIRLQAAEDARVQLRVPGEPEVFDALLKAETPEQIREICQDAFVPVPVQVAPGQFKEMPMRNWPISGGSTLPHYLSEHAAAFLDAKKDPRFPRSPRPSTRLKQIWFLCRALAGALYGLQPRTAVNLIGSRRPEETFAFSRAAKPERKKSRTPRSKDT